MKVVANSSNINMQEGQMRAAMVTINHYNKFLLISVSPGRAM